MIGGSQTALEMRKAAGLLGLFVLIVFAPALLGGRVLAAPGDGILYYYPLRVHVAHELGRGELPSWNPYIFNGFPLLADSEAGVFYPPNWLFLLLPAPLAMNTVVISSYFLASLFTYLYSRAVGASFTGAILSGMAFGGSGFLITRLPHTTIVNGAAWFPLLMWSVERLRHHASPGNMAGTAFAAAMPVLAGHPQIAFYSILTAAVYLLYFAAREPPPGGPRRYLAAGGAALCAGSLLAACQILPTWELAHLSNRARLSFESFGDPSLPPSHLLLLLIPYAFGGANTGPYTFGPLGWSLSEATAYVGLVPLSLALSSWPLGRSSRHVQFWLGFGSLALVMALGQYSPIHRLLYLFPGYNLFRSPARNLMEVDFALAVLCGLAATHARSLATSIRRTTLSVAGLTVVLSIGLAVVGPTWGSLFDATVPRTLAVSPDSDLALRFAPAILAILASLALFHLVNWHGRRAQTLLALVTATDLVLFGSLWYQPFSFPTTVELGRPSTFLGLLAQRGGDLGERFLSLNPADDDEFTPEQPNASLLRGVRSAGGNSSFILRRYGELISWTDPFVGVDLSRVGEALNLLGVRHLFVSDRLLQPPATLSVDGVGLANSDLGLALARGGHDATEIPLPDLRCSSLAIDATTMPERLTDGVPLLRVVVTTEADETFSGLLPSGWAEVDWAGAPRTRVAPEASRSLWDFPGTRLLRSVRVETLADVDTVRIEQVVLHDALTGHSLAVGGAKSELTRLRPVPHRVEVAGGDVQASALDFVSAISGPTTLAQGQVIARVMVFTREGPAQSHFLRVGIDTSEWAWERPDVRAQIQHRMAPVAETFHADGGFLGHRYRGHLDLGSRQPIHRVVVEHVGPDSSFILDRIEAVDGDARTKLPMPLDSVELVPESAAPNGARTLDLQIPSFTASAVELLTALQDSSGLHQGQPVAAVVIRTEDDRTIERFLKAGEEVSEWAWDRPDLRGRVLHSRARIAESFPVAGAAYEGHRYLSRLDLGGSARIVGLRIENLVPVASLEVKQVCFLGSSPLCLPASLPTQLLSHDETRPWFAIETPSNLATGLAVVSRLGRAGAVEHRSPVGDVGIWGVEGDAPETELRAGEHTSEWRAREPDVRSRLKHHEAALPFFNAAGYPRGPWYLTLLPLGPRGRVRRIELEAVHPSAVVSVAALSLHDETTGRSTPLSGIQTELTREGRWQRMLGTTGATIFYNSRAMPRAWLAQRVQVLPPADVRAAIKVGRFPGGHPFAPMEVALVEEGVDQDFGPLDSQAKVAFVEDETNRVVIESRSRTASFLVLTDAAYPGWTAKVDGVAVPIRVTDYAFRGLQLAAGRHLIEFVYRPVSIVVGVAVSLIALTGLMLCAPAPWRVAVVLVPLTTLAMALHFSRPRPSAGEGPAANGGRLPASVARLGTSLRVWKLSTPGEGSAVLGDGWWTAEPWSEGRAGRWTKREARLILERRSGEHGLVIEMSLDHPDERNSGRIEVNGKVCYVIQGPNGPRTARIELAGVDQNRLEVRFVMDSFFVPRLRHETEDARELGVFVHDVRLVGSR